MTMPDGKKKVEVTTDDAAFAYAADAAFAYKLFVMMIADKPMDNIAQAVAEHRMEMARIEGWI
jgi:hypothetical protein